MPRKNRRMICVHCHQDRCCYGRGLCGKCYYEPGLRERYPLLPHPKRRSDGLPCKDDGLTAEDVERIVAEQSACLPDWFYQDMRALGKEVARLRDREAYDRFAARTVLPRKWRGKA